MGTKAWQDSRCETKMAPQGHFPAISTLDHVGPGNLNTASKTRSWLEPLAQRFWPFENRTDQRSNRLSAEFDDLIQALRRLRYRLPEYIQLLFTDRFRCLTWKMPKSGVHLNENVFLLNVVTDPSFDIYIFFQRVQLSCSRSDHQWPWWREEILKPLLSTTGFDFLSYRHIANSIDMIRKKILLTPSPLFLLPSQWGCNYWISTHPLRYYPHDIRFSLDRRCTGIFVELTEFSRAWSSSTLCATRQPRISPLLLFLEAFEIKEKDMPKMSWQWIANRQF
jgi:hypothetical protein